MAVLLGWGMSTDLSAAERADPALDDAIESFVATPGADSLS